MGGGPLALLAHRATPCAAYVRCVSATSAAYTRPIGAPASERGAGAVLRSRRQDEVDPERGASGSRPGEQAVADGGGRELLRRVEVDQPAVEPVADGAPEVLLDRRPGGGS